MATILIVDDEPAIRELLANVLEEEYSVLIAKDGEEVFPLLRVAQVDMLLLDLQMKKMGGAEVVRTLCEKGMRSDYAVVLLSGECDLQREAERLQVDAYLRKPFDLEDLFHVLHTQMVRFFAA